jgi:hypothetical protein
MADAEQRLTLAEAARRSGHSPVTLRQAVQRGALRAARVGEGNRSTLYVTLADLRAYLERRRAWRGYGQVPGSEPDGQEASTADEGGA